MQKHKYFGIREPGRSPATDAAYSAERPRTRRAPGRVNAAARKLETGGTPESSAPPKPAAPAKSPPPAPAKSPASGYGHPLGLATGKSSLGPAGRTPAAKPSAPSTSPKLRELEPLPYCSPNRGNPR